MVAIQKDTSKFSRDAPASATCKLNSFILNRFTSSDSGWMPMLALQAAQASAHHGQFHDNAEVVRRQEDTLKCNDVRVRQEAMVADLPLRHAVHMLAPL